MKNLEHDQRGAKLTGLNLYRWTNYVAKSTIPSDEALFIVNVTTKEENERSSFVASFKLKSLCHVHALVIELISNANLFCPKTAESLAQQVTDHITSCFSFHLLKPPHGRLHDCCLHCFSDRRPENFNFHRPRLVFVADVVTYHDHDLDHDYGREDKVELEDDHYNHDQMSPYQTPQRYYMFMQRAAASYARFNSDILDMEPTALPDLALYSNSSTQHYLLNRNKDATECIEPNADTDEEFIDVLNILRSWYSGSEPTTKRKPTVPMVENLPPKRMKLNSNEQQPIHESKPSSAPLESSLKVKPALEIINPARESVDGDTNCSICLDTLSNEAETVKMVRCNHEFHCRCIFDWLTNKQSCPNCRSSSLANVYV